MLKNILKVLMSNFIVTAVGLINSFVFPAIMSVESYSAYHEFTLYVSYINVCHLGIATGMFVYYGGKDYKTIDRARYKGEISLILCVLAFFTTIGIGLSYFIQSALIFKVALSIYPVCMIASFKAMYQAWNRFTAYSVINVITTAALTAGVLLYYLFCGEVSSTIIIALYLMIQYGVFIYFMLEYFLFVRKVKREPMFSKQNFDTTKTGFLIMMGNYVMLLFHGLDKQFVNTLYSAYDFAMYSFASSTTNIMNVFITALSTPFYPRLAKQDMDKKQLDMLKEMLFIFGAYSGCAYFAVSFIVEHFIPKYQDSLFVVYLFFATFPASAVINVLYVNLYKVTKQVKKYIGTLVGILVVSFILNVVAVLLNGGFVGISAATLCTYYVWLLYSQRDFKDIVISKKDFVYLVFFAVIYLACIKVSNVIIGFVIYGVVITVVDFVFYRDSLGEAISMVCAKFIKKGKVRN